MVQTQGTGGMDRRSLLKKSAAAGALVWAAPSVTSLSQAHAIGDGEFTNCFPDASFKLIQTNQDCTTYNNFSPKPPGYPETLDPSCCQESLYVFTIAANCGDTCEADESSVQARLVSIVSGDATLEPKPGCKEPGIVEWVNNKNCQQAGKVSILITYSITCEDGITYACTPTVEFDLTNCPAEATGVLVGSAFCQPQVPAVSVGSN